MDRDEILRHLQGAKYRLEQFRLEPHGRSITADIVSSKRTMAAHCILIVLDFWRRLVFRVVRIVDEPSMRGSASSASCDILMLLHQMEDRDATEYSRPAQSTEHGHKFWESSRRLGHSVDPCSLHRASAALR